MKTLAPQALRVGSCLLAAKFLTVLVVGAAVTLAGDVRIAPSHYIVGWLILLGMIGAYFGYRRYHAAAVVFGVIAGVALSTGITVMLAPDVDTHTGGTWWQPVWSMLVGCVAAFAGFAIAVRASARRRE